MVKAVIKGIALFFRKLLYTIIWFCEVLLKTDFKNHIISKRRDKVLCVLGNGPSLRESIKNNELAEGDYMVVNYFYNSPFFEMIKPAYYIIQDPYFFAEEKNFNVIIEKTTWEMTFFVPFLAWKRYPLLQNVPNKYIHIVPYHWIQYKGFVCIKNKIYKKGLSMPRPQNVIVPALFNGINMGYKEIHLYGAEHSWTKTLCVTPQNVVSAIDTHFYDKDEKHLEPYLKGLPGGGFEYYKLHELLRDFATMFESYHHIRSYADWMGCCIINKTKESFIDAFEHDA